MTKMRDRHKELTCCSSNSKVWFVQKSCTSLLNALFNLGVVSILHLKNVSKLYGLLSQDVENVTLRCGMTLSRAGLTVG